MCYYGSPHQGGPYQSLTGSCLLLHHLFHSLFCTTDVPMYTAGESVFYRRSDGSLVPATVLGPGAQSETVQIEYKRNERLVRHPAALIANLFFPRYGVAHGCAQEPTPGSAVKFRGKSVRKNQPLVPRSNIAGSWARGGEGTRV